MCVRRVRRVEMAMSLIFRETSGDAVFPSAFWARLPGHFHFLPDPAGPAYRDPHDLKS